VPLRKRFAALVFAQVPGAPNAFGFELADDFRNFLEPKRLLRVVNPLVVFAQDDFVNIRFPQFVDDVLHDLRVLRQVRTVRRTAVVHNQPFFPPFGFDYAFGHDAITEG